MPLWRPFVHLGDLWLNKLVAVPQMLIVGNWCKGAERQIEDKNQRDELNGESNRPTQTHKKGSG